MSKFNSASRVMWRGDVTMSTWRSRLGTVVVSGVLGISGFTVSARAAAPADTPSIPSVRAASAGIQAFIDRGTARSSSFRELLARIQRTGWEVIVLRGRCPAREIVACLPHTIANVEGRILARVIIDERRMLVADDAIGYIAHELQHVAEAAEPGDVVDAASMRARFREIGYVSLGGMRSRSYETDAAVQAGLRVREEMYRARTASNIDVNSARLKENLTILAARRSKKPEATPDRAGFVGE